MSVTATDRPDGARAPASEHRRHVLVLCESGPHLAKTLEVALAVLESIGGELTVAAVTRQDRTDVGCGTCRRGAMFRNEGCLESANTEVAHAHELIQDLGAPRNGTIPAYEILTGPLVATVTRYARERHVNLILLPLPQRGFLRTWLARRRAERIRGRGEWSVQFVPAIG